MISLDKLVENGLLGLSDILYARYQGQEYTANLEMQNTSGRVAIRYNNLLYDSPSSAATAVTTNNVNGWSFWSAKDQLGVYKGSLVELRRKLEVAQTPVDSDEDE
jgi:hypothetical protein